MWYSATLSAFTIFFFMQVVFGILMLVYIPDLDLYPGYFPIGVEVASEQADYQTLPGGEQL